MAGSPASTTVPDIAQLLEIIVEAQVRTVFQPIVDLETGEVLALEALSRGPAGPYESPTELFRAAEATGLTNKLDHACFLAALRNASELQLQEPIALFVNVEPGAIATAPLDDLAALTQRGLGLRIVVEITERALASRPAELLTAAERVRQLGWAIALDDVGADSASLTFMDLLRPDIVKLDLGLVQQQPSRAVAEVIHAVNAYAERSGALVLAEGIETSQHLEVARALGATLGQGWLFGHPDPRPAAVGHDQWLFPRPPAGIRSEQSLLSAFSHVPRSMPVRRSSKRLLIELSKQLEREAMRAGEIAMLAATFQLESQFTPSTARRYEALSGATGFVCAIAAGLPTDPAPGVRGAALGPSDPMLQEWNVVVVHPHFTAALLARDLGDSGPELDRRFDYVLTYKRDLVTAAARTLLSRITPHD